MEFSRQEYWSGLSFSFTGDLPDPEIEPRSPAMQADSLPTEPPGKSIVVCMYVGIYIYIYIYMRDQKMFGGYSVLVWASQVVLIIKKLPANAGDMRHGFNPWVGKFPWRRAWQPTPVFLPGKSHGQRSLVSYSP